MSTRPPLCDADFGINCWLDSVVKSVQFDSSKRSEANSRKQFQNEILCRCRCVGCCCRCLCELIQLFWNCNELNLDSLSFFFFVHAHRNNISFDDALLFSLSLGRHPRAKRQSRRSCQTMHPAIGRIARCCEEIEGRRHHRQQPWNQGNILARPTNFSNNSLILGWKISQKFATCFFKNVGFLNEQGDFDEQKTIDKLSTGSTPDEKKKIEQLVKGCKAQAGSSSKEDLSLNLYRCYVKNKAL